jgi:hypothetical protein
MKMIIRKGTADSNNCTYICFNEGPAHSSLNDAVMLVSSLPCWLFHISRSRICKHSYPEILADDNWNLPRRIATRVLQSDRVSIVGEFGIVSVVALSYSKEERVMSLLLLSEIGDMKRANEVK